MNDETSDLNDIDLLPEYDFSAGVRGKHAGAYGKEAMVTVYKADGTSEERVYTLPEGVIILDPDVRPFFPDAKSVNRALRGLVELIPVAQSAGSQQIDEIINQS